MGSQVNEKKKRKKEGKKERRGRKEKEERTEKKGSKVFTLVDIEQVRKTSFSLQS